MARSGSWAACVVALAFAASGCASASRVASAGGPPASAASVPAASSLATPVTAASGGHVCPPHITPTPDANGVVHGVAVDRVDAITLNGHNYVAANNTPVAAASLGRVVGHVQCILAGDPAIDPNYRMLDGDATFVPVGTSVYAVQGTPVDRAIAAEHDGVTRLYTVEPAS